jgi:hypothetical protein
MKKLIIAAAFILLAGVAFGQPFHKGNFLSLNTTTINLAPDVTMEQYLDFYVNKYIPQAEKYLPGFKIFISKGIRGDKENSIGILYFCESEKYRDQYFIEGTTDTMNEVGIAGMEKLQPYTDELYKLGTFAEDFVWTDWVIQ